MAKAKKSESADAAPAKKAPARKAGGAKKTSAKSAKPAAAAPAGAPTIDPNLVAASAAQMLLARKKIGNLDEAPAGRGTIEQLKQEVSKPHRALDNLFQSTAPKNAGHAPLPHLQQSQPVRGQTKGADVSRVSVPRRTAG